MERQEIMVALSTLLHVERAAMGAYDAVLGKIHDSRISGSLKRFREDHQRHAERLARIIQEAGEQPVARFRELDGFNDTLLDALSDATELGELLYSLRIAEAAYLLLYGQVANAGVGPGVHAEIKEMLKDEEAHVNFLDVASTAALKV